MVPLRVFRPAQVRSTRVNVAWTLLQSAIVWSLALVAAPALLLALEPTLGFGRIELLRQPVFATLLFLACSTLNLVTGIVLAAQGRGTPLPVACPRALVVSGPYRYVRNPMAIAGIGQGLAIGLWFGSPLLFLYAFTGAVVWHVIVRPVEERDLRLRFGRAYDTYHASVPLWWPRRQPFHTPAT